MILYLGVNSTFWRCVKLSSNQTIRLLLKTVSRLTITASRMRTGTLQGRIHPAVALRSSTRHSVVATVYRPPQTSLVNFYVELADLLTIIASQTNCSLVLGNFNCSGDEPTTIATELSKTSESLGLVQHVHQPTRHENLLDLVVTD
jgi:hypothetical protein